MHNNASKSSETVYKGNFYSFCLKTIECKSGCDYTYECIKVSGPGAAGGVEVMAIVRRGGRKFVVVIENYRYAVDSWVLEFPGGMCDPNETIQETAMRELREETGFVGSRVLLSQEKALADPWKSDEVS